MLVGVILTEQSSDVPDSNLNRIQNALSITSMDDLVNYSFTSSEDSTSRDITSVFSNSIQSEGSVYYYNVSGTITNQSYSLPDGPYTLNFTRRT